jgi:hypothetical protein
MAAHLHGDIELGNFGHGDMLSRPFAAGAAINTVAWIAASTWCSAAVWIGYDLSSCL